MSHIGAHIKIRRVENGSVYSLVDGLHTVKEWICDDTPDDKLTILNIATRALDELKTAEEDHGND